MRKLRGLRARLSFHVSRLINAWRRTQGSLRRRGIIGTVRRIGTEFRRGQVPITPVADLPQDDGLPFSVPGVDSPVVSIVIPVYNKIEYTVACLRSLAQHAGPTPFEVILVDDCSSDDTPRRLASVSGVRVHRNAENLGFVGSCNAGAALSRGDYVLFLNNDTVVTPNWLEALMACFRDEPEAGLVGAKLVYPDGRLQEAGGIVFRDGSGWNYGRFDNPADPAYNFRREADYCSGAAIMLRRELFERLGGFDRRYAPAYYEDTDLAFAVRAAGLKVFYEPASTVIHFEGITAGTDTGSGIKRYQVVNREKFLDKWKDALALQPAPIDDPADARRAATFRHSRRILIIDACTPTPDQDSGSLRMVNLMRLLKALGWHVSFFSENRLYLDRYTPALQSLGVEVLYHPFLSDPIRFFRERGREYDAIVLSRHYVAINYLGLARLYARQARLIFDTVDLHYLRERRAAELEGSGDLLRKAELTRAQEQKLIRECDVTLVVSPVEKDILATEVPNTRVEILSNVHEVFGCRRPFDERSDLVFVGSFQHPPNEDAVLWFAREVFPRVRLALPEVRFHVIGHPPPPDIQALADDRLIVHGFVEDLEPFMDGCRISVAPLRYGAGVKGKVNMAMSYGLPVVATGCAVEGMHIAAGSDVLVAEDAAAFADAIVRLYHDKALWKTLSANGLANVQRHFSFDAAKRALENILT
ncbi:glycosyltransferase [Tahibacter amnicola]